MKRFGFCYGFLFLPSIPVTAADPPTWTYTAILTGDRGSTTVSAGFGVRPDFNSPDGFDHFQGFTILTPAATAGLQSGSGRVAIGSTPGSSSFYWLDDASNSAALAAIDPRFVASITIRDERSGQSGTVGVSGTALASDSWLGMPADLNLPAVPDLWQSPDPSSHSLILGQNRYTVSIGEVKDNERNEGFLGPDWDQLRVVADVDVSPAQTPEPSTVVLTGAGLVCGLSWRLPRRMGIPKRDNGL